MRVYYIAFILKGDNNKMSKKNDTTICRNGFQLLSRYRGAIMGIAAIWILVFHKWIQLTVDPADGSFELINFLEKFIKKIGFCGVDIFLMLSGIGLTFAIKKESLPKFYYRRIRRIILPFLAIAVIRWRLEKWNTQLFLRNISGYNFYTVKIYSFLWFVPAIITLYLLFPLYYKIFSKVKDKIMFTTGTVTLWLLITLIVRDKMRIDMFGFTNRIPIFVIGILFGYLTQNRKEIVFTIQTYLHLLVTLSLGLYLAYISNFFGYGLIVPVGNCCFPNCLIAVSLPFLIAKVLDVFERRLYLFGKGVVKVLSFFGTFSLEFYCVQEWFAGIMIPKLTEKGWSNLKINIAIFLMITAVSWAASVMFKYFWKLVEFPFSRKKTAEVAENKKEDTEPKQDSASDKKQPEMENDTREKNTGSKKSKRKKK